MEQGRLCSQPVKGVNGKESYYEMRWTIGAG